MGLSCLEMFCLSSSQLPLWNMSTKYCTVTQTWLNLTLTGAFHALVYEAIQQRAAVVAEGGAGVCVDLKRVSTLQVLKCSRNYLRENVHIRMHTVTEDDTHTHAHGVWLVAKCWAGHSWTSQLAFPTRRAHINEKASRQGCVCVCTCVRVSARQRMSIYYAERDESFLSLFSSSGPLRLNRRSECTNLFPPSSLWAAI